MECIHRMFYTSYLDPCDVSQVKEGTNGLQHVTRSAKLCVVRNLNCCQTFREQHSSESAIPHTAPFRPISTDICNQSNGRQISTDTGRMC